MPELPEVETVARELRDLIPGKEISKIQALWHKSFENQCSLPLPGQIVEEIGRKGKYLIIKLSQSVLIVHLRMTGQLLFKSSFEENTDKYIRAKIIFADNTALFFKDTRKFGRIYHVRDAQDILYKIGFDAIDAGLDVNTFKNLLSGSKLSVKAFLLSQDKIAGVGNIYADESLFRAGIHPASQANKIPESQADMLYSQLKATLANAINNMGSTISDYRDSYGNSGNNQKFFMVYQRAGQTCTKCAGLISKSKMAGRGTHFCPKCQTIYK
ncbi:MAG: bifunctional DNA-formamidopyrimidine glycosylase/DNA-(apurinic or apyrimidinic site) lyase [Calditrichaceae bacterium]